MYLICQKSVVFYSRLLGFRLGELYPNKTNPTYAPIFVGKDKLMLVSARDSNKKFYQKGLDGSGFQLFIKAEDVDKIYERIKNKITIIDEIETKSWGDREFTLKDPDGYLMTFYGP